jgi:hypothetical protein
MALCDSPKEVTLKMLPNEFILIVMSDASG